MSTAESVEIRKQWYRFLKEFAALSFVGLQTAQLCTGRQISTPQSHLQPTTCLAVDKTSNFLLSGSSDSNIHLWSIPSLLSFLPPSSNDASQPLPYSPLRSLSNHRAAINAIEFGHSSSNSNIAVSASLDNTCIVWDYISGEALHTFLLSSSPICLALDPADRAAYTGFEDGSVQILTFYPRHPLTHPLHDSTLQSTPTQPPPADRWISQNPTPSATLSMQLSHDGTSLLSGHEDGTIQTWDTATGHSITTLADLSAPITNLKMIVPTGFPTAFAPSLKAHHIVKPRYERSLGDSSSSISGVPANYTFITQFTSTLAPSSPYSTDFQSALTSPTFPPSLLDASIADLISLPSSTQDPINPSNPSPDDLAAQNTLLLSQLNAALHTQREAMKQVLEMDRERLRKAEEEKVKKERKRRRRERRREEEKKKRAEVAGDVFVRNGGAGAESGMGKGEGNGTSDVEEHETAEEGEDLSSSTDEISDSE